ncbi:MAG: putative fluoride ion transporter CrcB [Phycisphaerae bacterium]|nr:putative fluoride ion transporter CrcB [Phycisphaerae bacterium]
MPPGQPMPGQDALLVLKLALVFVGSGVGGVGRYLLSGWAQRWANGTFPLGTLVVNLLGCVLIGFLTAAFAGRWLVREELRVAAVVGVLGGFTTFSAFGMETFAFLNDGQYARAWLNIALSVGLGLIGVWGGYRLAESWLGV